MAAMDTKDIITLAIAVYGAVLSTYNLYKRRRHIRIASSMQARRCPCVRKLENVPVGCARARRSLKGSNMSYEEMPIPQQGDDDFPNWLVPARNNIQRQLLRLQSLLGRPSKDRDSPPPRIPPRDSTTWIMGWLLGVGFSLWRAVFQAGHALDRDINFERGRIFLNEIIRNNTAVYSTELNSWSLGYYLNNARFRLIVARKLFATGERTAELDTFMAKIDSSIEGGQGDAPAEWVICFHAMRLMLDLLEK
jgi:hypothetical protein